MKNNSLLSAFGRALFVLVMLLSGSFTKVAAADEVGNTTEPALLAPTSFSWIVEEITAGATYQLTFTSTIDSAQTIWFGWDHEYPTSEWRTLELPAMGTATATLEELFPHCGTNRIQASLYQQAWNKSTQYGYYLDCADQDMAVTVTATATKREWDSMHLNWRQVYQFDVSPTASGNAAYFNYAFNDGLWHYQRLITVSPQGGSFTYSVLATDCSFEYAMSRYYDFVPTGTEPVVVPLVNGIEGECPGEPEPTVFNIYLPAVVR